jgi:hypothetical protein
MSSSSSSSLTDDEIIENDDNDPDHQSFEVIQVPTLTLSSLASSSNDHLLLLSTSLPPSSRYHTPREREEEWSALSPDQREIIRISERINSFFPITASYLNDEVRGQEYAWEFNSLFPLATYDKDTIWKRLWNEKILINIFMFLNLASVQMRSPKEVIVSGMQTITLQVFDVKPSLDLYATICQKWQSYPREDFTCVLYVMQSEVSREVRFQLICQSEHIKLYFPYFRGYITYHTTEKGFVQTTRTNCLIKASTNQTGSMSGWLSSAMRNREISNNVYSLLKDLFEVKLPTLDIYLQLK